MWVAAAALWAQQPGTEPEGLLERIKAHVGDGLLKLPDYTCLETIERYERQRPSQSFVLSDRLRLEVAFVEGKEYFAWPGESRFEETKISRLVPAGTIGNGNFALHAFSVFRSSAPVYTYKGEQAAEDRRLIRYDFRVPQPLSGHLLRVSGREATVGFRGSFQVDRDSLDLLRLEVVAEEIPPFLGLDYASDTMQYTAVRIGPQEFSLPSSSELLLRMADGSESKNVTRFTNCRQYTGESILSFAGPVGEPGSGAPAERRQIRLPPGATLELSLETPVDSATSAVGDRIEAMLAHDVRQRGLLIAPRGARVTGRIVRLARLSAPLTHYEFEMRFFTLEFGNTQVEFQARLEAVVAPGGLSTYQTGSARLPRDGNRRAMILVGEPEGGPGSGLVIVTSDRLHLPRGFRMLWRVIEGTGVKKP